MNRTILVTGPCGSGKSAVLWHAREAFGECAAIDVDRVYMFIDPDWSVRDDRYGAVALRNTGRLIGAYFEEGLSTVLVAGNGLHQRGAIEVLLPYAAGSDVHHVVLDCRVDVIKARIAARGDANKPPEWLEAHVEWMRGFYEPWSIFVDNSELTPVQTVVAIRERVEAGEGRVP